MSIVQTPRPPEQIIQEVLARSGPLAMLRRKELERLLDFNGIDHRAGASAETMRRIAQEEMDLGKQLKMPPPGWKPETEKPAEPVKTVLEKSPDEMGVFELKRVCKQKGIKTKRTDTKAILLEKLRGQNAS